MEPRKRLIQIDNKEITVWPIQEFLEQMWSHQGAWGAGIYYL
ncbi:hypothetical protein MHYMCMPSP_01116 [Hyalomma marginatum]|uniref:Uncharacterized protein n=1 Tax=Hyalomma marginatum TaxID=34627 RepID=A0A8S4C377_9ACAR|nr:hypothetical protein MHYMCMPSP_01116 [Hyalomma marginatum]CAG7600545.1 hypothetical protein MHYMCMPASI_01187 [Hyalomma marginatum]